MRTETDFLGDKQIPSDALYGIHSIRARENFPDTTPFFIEWYKAVGLVKLAVYETYKLFKTAVASENLPVSFRWMDDAKLESLIHTAREISNGEHFEHFIVPAIQGGAGTSINLNINEIICNRALQKLAKPFGTYEYIDPFEDANVFQSTNDVIPTALKVAVMFLLNDLESSINALREKVEEKEKEYRNDLRIGYTQMQEAVPSSFGRLFGNYSEALSRDWWRISKCFERIKVVNLGGGAIGTGIAIPRFYIMEVVHQLQKITRLPVTRGENLQDTTSNLDALVEVHAILKANAVNLEKMVNDIRLLSSDITSREIIIPQKQVGSTIMPGKVNPVVPEFVVSAAHKVYANDQVITSLCAQGCLDLNAYIPVIGHCMIDSLKLLIACQHSLSNHLYSQLDLNTGTAVEKLYRSASITTALIPNIGYNRAAELAREMKSSKSDIFEANKKLKLVSEEQLKSALLPDNLLKLGFSIKEP